MSEEQPLLPHPEAPSLRERAAQKLESKLAHTVVILLVALDTIFVLLDLGYTFLSPDCSPGEEPPAWLEVLSYLSLVITGMFLLEIPMNLWVFGRNFFNPFGPVPHASLHGFDAIVIVTTFVLEVVLRGKERELASLLIILRMWRLVKLVGGVAVGAGELEEENARILMETRRELEDVQAHLEKAREENIALRQTIDQRNRTGVAFSDFPS